MADKNFVTTPADCPATPSDRGAKGTFNSEPGYPGRTMGPNSEPEKIYESEHPTGDSSTGTFVSTPSKPPFGR